MLTAREFDPPPGVAGQRVIGAQLGSVRDAGVRGDFVFEGGAHA